MNWHLHQTTNTSADVRDEQHNFLFEISEVKDGRDAALAVEAPALLDLLREARQLMDDGCFFLPSRGSERDRGIRFLVKLDEKLKTTAPLARSNAPSGAENKKEVAQ